MSIVALYAIIVPFFICVPLILGIYVYRDAKSRGMNAILWALVAGLAPTFLGFIIYLLVRGSYSNLLCAQCGERVQEAFVVCPRCGVPLKASCSGCGLALEEGWKVCPRCARPLEPETQEVIPPVKPQDKGLGKILLVVILLPVAFLLLLYMNMSFSAVNSVGATHTVHYGEPDLMMLANELEIYSLVDGIRDQGIENETMIYALVSHRPAEEMTRYTYLLYLPHAEEDTVTSGHSTGLFGSEIEISYQRGENEKGVFLAVTAFHEGAPELQVQQDGKKVPVQLIHVPDQDLSQFIEIE